MKTNEDVARLKATFEEFEPIEQLQNIGMDSLNNIASNSFSTPRIPRDKNFSKITSFNDIYTQIDSFAPSLQKLKSISSIKYNKFDSLKSPFERSLRFNNRKDFFRCSSCNLETAGNDSLFPVVYRHLDSDLARGKYVQYALFRPLSSFFTTDDLDFLSLPLCKCECPDLSATSYTQPDLSPISEPLGSTYTKKESIFHPFSVVNCRKASKSGKRVVCYSITRLLNFGSDNHVYQCIDRDNLSSYALKLISKEGRYVLHQCSPVNHSFRGRQLVEMYEHLYEDPHPNLPNVVHVLEDIDLYYVVIDNIRGPLLSEIITSHLPGCIPKEDVKRIVKDLLNILRYLHGKSISLNNLSLENISFKEPLESGCDFDPSPSPRFSKLSQPLFEEVPTIIISNIDSFAAHHSPKTIKMEEDLWSVGYIMYCLLQGIPTLECKKSFNPFNTLSNDNWEGLDKEMDLCKRLLAVDPLLRVTTVQEALIHPLFHL